MTPIGEEMENTEIIGKVLGNGGMNDSDGVEGMGR
jgi:hypothetical protein